jgi:hypothetical protein
MPFTLADPRDEAPNSHLESYCLQRFRITRRQLLGVTAAFSAGAAFGARGSAENRYPQTAAEAHADIKVFDSSYPPGAVDRYARNLVPGSTDMSAAVQSAADAGCGFILFLESTYLFCDVDIHKPVVIQGSGFGSVLLARTDVLGSIRYSRNLFTCVKGMDYLSFRDLTLDGGCDNPSAAHAHELSLIRIAAVSRVDFMRIKVTRYCAAWDGVVKPVSKSFWQAITVHGVDKVVFKNCLLTNNHYEQVLIWNGPSSRCETFIDGCRETNDGSPDAHTAFDISGGHINVVNNTFTNTGSSSVLNIQVPKSARVANNRFEDMQAGAAAQINIGQSTFPGNDNLIIENNYCRNANSAAIEIGPGTNIVIRGNVIDTPNNYGIQITGAVDDFATFNAIFPEWPRGKSSESRGINISGNTINGVKNSASLSRGIFMHSVAKGRDWWFRDVQILDNTVTASAPPNNTYFGMWLDDLLNAQISGNRLQYTQSAIYFSGVVDNLRIDFNIFQSVAPSKQSDLVFYGKHTSSTVLVARNQFVNIPVGPTHSILLGEEYSISELRLLNNAGLHPVLPVLAHSPSVVVQRQTKDLAPGARPSSGDWGINDIAGRYICIEAGSFGPQLTCTVSGEAGDYLFSCSSIEQLRIGQHFSVKGAGPGHGDLRCTCAFIAGAKIYVDQIIATTVRQARLELAEPGFAAREAGD